MEQDEIDSWYEEEKQKCIDRYLEDMQKAKNHDEAEKKYEERLNKVIERYNRLSEEKLKSKKTGKFRDFILSIKKMVYSFK